MLNSSAFSTFGEKWNAGLVKKLQAVTGVLINNLKGSNDFSAMIHFNKEQPTSWGTRSLSGLGVDKSGLEIQKCPFTKTACKRIWHTSVPRMWNPGCGVTFSEFIASTVYDH